LSTPPRAADAGRHVLLALGILIVAGMSATYYGTRERAFVIAVRWSLASAPEERAVLRVRHSLRQCETVPDAERTEECAILDRSRPNVRQLIDSPLIEDTNYVERGSALFTEPRLSPHWTWAAHRVPLLRRPAVIESILILGLALIAVGASPYARRAAPRVAHATKRGVLATGEWVSRPVRAGWAVPATLGVFFAIPLTVHAYLATRSRFIADDYCSVVSVDKAGGIMPAAVSTYLTWSGRFSAHALDGAVVGLGPRRAGYVAGIAVIVFAAVIAGAIWAAIRRLRPGDSRTAISAAAGCYLLAAVFHMTPDVHESLYWGQGMRTVVPPLILGVALATLLVLPRPATGGRRAQWLLAGAAFLIAMIAAMFGESYATMQAAAAGLLAAALFWRDRRNIPPRVLAALAGAAAGLAIVAASPGNAVRKAFFPPTPAPIDLARMTTVHTMEFVGDILAGQWLAVAGLMALGAVLGILVPSDPRLRTRGLRFEAVFVAATSFVLLAAFAPAAYGLSQPLPGRTKLVPAFVLAAALVVLAYRQGERVAVSTRVPQAVRNLAVAAFVGSLAWTSLIYYAWAIDRQPVIEDYLVYWDRVDAEILRARSRGEKRVRIRDPIENWAGLEDIGADPSFWVNSCVSDYYGIQVTSPPLR
jgi:hypothetical protein